MTQKMIVLETDGRQKAVAIPAGGGSSGIVCTLTFTMPTTVKFSGSLVLTLSGVSGLVGGSIAGFEITDWDSNVTTQAATANAATVSLTAPATIGQVVSVSVVAIDNLGNRSSVTTRQSSVIDHASPTGTITVTKDSIVGANSSGNTISFTGGTAYDGATISYQIDALSSGITFSKTAGITSGESITYTVPNIATATSTLSINVRLTDNQGGVGSDQSVSIDVFQPTVLLLNGDGTNGSQVFTDLSLTPKQITTFGNTQVSTAVKKYGTGSIKFDGTGDYLTIPHSTDLRLGSSDFTIEFWMYKTTAKTSCGIINKWVGFEFFIGNSSGNLGAYLSGNNSSFTSFVLPNEPSLNAWHHIAVVRKLDTVTIYVDGVNSVSGTFTGGIYQGTSNIVIGTNGGILSGWEFPGYIDDIRITKGIARYTANFTPPAQALTI